MLLAGEGERCRSSGLQKGVIHFQCVELGDVKWKRGRSGWALKIKWAGEIMENKPGERGKQAHILRASNTHKIEICV